MICRGQKLSRFFVSFYQEIDDDVDSSLEDSQDVYEGNKDAARALMRVKQKLDGYEEGEMRSVQGQVNLLLTKHAQIIMVDSVHS